RRRLVEDVPGDQRIAADRRVRGDDDGALHPRLLGGGEERTRALDVDGVEVARPEPRVDEPRDVEERGALGAAAELAERRGIREVAGREGQALGQSLEP